MYIGEEKWKKLPWYSWYGEFKLQNAFRAIRDTINSYLFKIRNGLLHYNQLYQWEFSFRHFINLRHSILKINFRWITKARKSRIQQFYDRTQTDSKESRAPFTSTQPTQTDLLSPRQRCLRKPGVRYGRQPKPDEKLPLHRCDGSPSLASNIEPTWASGPSAYGCSSRVPSPL